MSTLKHLILNVWLLYISLANTSVVFLKANIAIVIWIDTVNWLSESSEKGSQKRGSNIFTRLQSYMEMFLVQSMKHRGVTLISFNSKFENTPWNLCSILQPLILFPFCSKTPSDSVNPNIKMAYEYTRSLTGVAHVFPDTTWGSQNTPSWWRGYFLRDLWSSIRAASDTPHSVLCRPSVLEGQQVGWL